MHNYIIALLVIATLPFSACHNDDDMDNLDQAGDTILIDSLDQAEDTILVDNEYTVDTTSYSIDSGMVSYGPGRTKVYLVSDRMFFNSQGILSGVGNFIIFTFWNDNIDSIIPGNYLVSFESELRISGISGRNSCGTNYCGIFDTFRGGGATVAVEHDQTIINFDLSHEDGGVVRGRWRGRLQEL